VVEICTSEIEDIALNHLTTNKEKDMGLDQMAHLRGRKVNWEKYYQDDKDEQSGVFVWRKHARLQTFMSNKFAEQNAEALKKQREKEKDKEQDFFDLGHLGMNGNDELYITEEIVKDLEKEWKDNYHHSFCSDGFFWGQQFQEEAVKEYKSQDKEFIDWCKEMIRNKKTVVYTCSW
jgi:hypothetical protein|tara:strand:+ start:409 stop:936 length:528 start_codon:yes stop_codon:yes gene_type:complete